MNIQKEIKLFAIGFSSIFLFFTTIALIRQDFQFIFYGWAMIPIMVLILLFSTIFNSYYLKLRLPFYLTCCFLVMWFFQLLGGIVIIDGIRLYDIYLISGVLRYDNLIHFSASYFTAFAVYNVFRKNLDGLFSKSKVLFPFILVMSVLGIGMINEVVELFSIYCCNTGSMVGSLNNNMLDVMMNLGGGVFASYSITKHYRFNLGHILERYDTSFFKILNTYFISNVS